MIIKRISCLLFSLCIIMLNMLVVFAESFNVTVNSELVSINGESSATVGSDYIFNVNIPEENQLDELYAEVFGSLPVNKNSGEGEKAATTILGATADDERFPEITITEDEDSPMKDVLTYKRVITDKINAGTVTTYKNQDISSFFSDKPESASFGFWLKESDIKAVYGDNPMEFWFYKNVANVGASYIIFSLPLKDLIENQGTERVISPSGTLNPDYIFNEYSINAKCMHRENGWAYIVCNMRELEYIDNFKAKGTLFYLYLSNVSGVLRQGKKIEMSNFTFMTQNEIESGYIIYPSQTSQSFKCAPKTMGEGAYAIVKEAVKGDITINAKGSVMSTYKEYGVSFEEVYTEVRGENIASNESDYPFSVSVNENTVLSSLYAEVFGSFPVNKNMGEGTSETTTLLAATADTTSAPEISMVTDDDSPMAGVLPYKRVIKDSLNAGTITTFKNQNISSLISDKPETISFGFWLKESDIADVYGSNGMMFMLFKGDVAATTQNEGASITVTVPLLSLMSQVGTKMSVSSSVATIENMFTDYSVNAVCTAKDNGWAHFVCNFEGLEYAACYDTANTLFYLELRNVSEVLRQGKKIEMSNFTFVTNDTVKNGYAVYPQSVTAESFKVAPKKLEDGTYLIAKENIKGNMVIKALANIIPEEEYIPQMKARIEGENLYVRTSFDDEYDLIQQFTGIYSDGVDSNGNDANEPFDYGRSGVISKASSSMTTYTKTYGYGVDESAPFKYNGVYIGANHGMPRAFIVNSTAHGKTYADIGSLWTDAQGTKWNLLKVPDSDNLVFISENLSSDVNKYSFKTSLSGTLTCADSRYAEHTENIVIESVTANQQLFPSVKKLEFKVFGVINGKKYALAEAQTLECDYIEIVEKYQIMNPALIGEALRAQRPDGGYTVQPSIAVGSPIVDYNMTYRITPDGTVLSIFDHTFLENVNFNDYGGIQYQLRYDAYGGGVYRYIPKLKSFTKNYNGTDIEYDFTEPINVTSAVASGNYIGYSDKYATSDLWEDIKNPPDRQIDYIYDSESIRASFAGGYLPLMQGEPGIRTSRTSESMYLYRSGKCYPHFVDSLAFGETGTKNQKIQGIAYKKYNGISDNDASLYTVPYGRDTYIYIDFHEICEKEFLLSDYVKADVKIAELEKSVNISYTLKDGKLKARMADGTYGYLVLCASGPIAEPVSVTKDVQTGEVKAVIKNNTFEEETIQVLVAGYKGNKLVQVKIEDVKLGSYQNYNLKTSLDAGTFDNVKVFVWNGLSDIMPKSLAVEG